MKKHLVFSLLIPFNLSIIFAQGVTSQNSTFKFKKEKINGALVSIDLPKTYFIRNVINPLKNSATQGTSKQSGWNIAKGFVLGEQTQDIYYKLNANKSISTLSFLVAQNSKFLDPVENANEFTIITTHIKTLAANAKKEALNNTYKTLSQDLQKSEKRLEKTERSIRKMENSIEKNNKEIEKLQAKNNKLLNKKNSEMEKRTKQQSDVESIRKQIQSNMTQIQNY